MPWRGAVQACEPPLRASTPLARRVVHATSLDGEIRVLIVLCVGSLVARRSLCGAVRRCTLHIRHYVTVAYVRAVGTFGCDHAEM